MKSLKNFIPFIILLSSMLLAFNLFMSINQAVGDYKETIRNDYTIVIITNTPLAKENISSLAHIDVEKIVTLSNKQILNKFQSKLSKNSLELLEKRLPYFYKIYLSEFPTSSELVKIKDELLAIKNVKSVETFSKDHTQKYLLLEMLNKSVAVLFIIIFIFAIIILAKQIKLWFYEHAKRLSIMQLHGATTLYSATPIIKTAILSSFIACFLVFFIMVFVENNINLFLPKELSDVIQISFTQSGNLVFTFLLSITVSVLTILGVLIQHKRK